MWGGQGTPEQLSGYQRFWGGHAQAKREPAAWIDLNTGETANYPLSAGGKRVVALTLGHWEQSAPEPRSGDQTYYSQALMLLAETAQKERAK